MRLRSKILLGAVVVFLIVNVLGAPIAAAMGEWMHAATHAALVFPSVFIVARLMRRRRDTNEPVFDDALTGELGEHLTRLQQSVDSIAVEVERIGEGQRFMARLLNENGTLSSRGQPVAEQNTVIARNTPSDSRDR